MEKKPRWRAATRTIRDAARTMRKEMTPAETMLWKAIRRGALDGISFRLQHAVGRFILDFYAPQHKLGIEVDGAVHDSQRERDAERSEMLALREIRIVRFRNEEVENDLPRVLERIRWEIQFQIDGPPEE
ncbi:MAG TPA: DUF559 domain-containing protein [Longimicrobium sp.]